jgi:hypothetical protein
MSSPTRLAMHAEARHDGRMRKTLSSWSRSIALWLFFGILTMLLFGVGGEFLIRAADDKGYYQDAGKRWDKGVAVIADLFGSLSAFATSTPVIAVMAASGGALFAWWVGDRRPLMGANDVPALPDSEDHNDNDYLIVTQKIARAHIIRSALPEIRDAIQKADDLFEQWLSISSGKIFGGGLISGNHRGYARAYDTETTRALGNVFMLLGRVRASDAVPVGMVNVEPGSILLRPAPGDQNLYNHSGDQPDQDRKMQHRVWYYEYKRTREMLDEEITNLATELSHAEYYIKSVSEPSQTATMMHL